MYFTIITALKKLFKNKIVIYKIKLFATGELFKKKKNKPQIYWGYIYQQPGSNRHDVAIAGFWGFN